MIIEKNCLSPQLDSFCTIGISAMGVRYRVGVLVGFVGVRFARSDITYTRNMVCSKREPVMVACVSTFSILIPTWSRIFSPLQGWIQILEQSHNLVTHGYRPFFKVAHRFAAELLHQRMPENELYVYVVKSMHKRKQSINIILTNTNYSWLIEVSPHTQSCQRQCKSPNQISRER